MANGTYGIRKPAAISPNDVDIFYHYRPTRGSDAPGFTEWKKGEQDWLLTTTVGGEALPGMYNLRLPMDIFYRKGIYSIYIKPKEIKTVIEDVSTLTGNFTNIRGIVLNTADVPFDNGELVGYRVEYIDLDNGSRMSDYRIITSNNKCEPVVTNMTGSAMQKAVRYRFNDGSNLMFCTVTPSTSMSFKPSSLPVIGKTGQEIYLINTKFNPIMIEVEMVEHDADTISTMLEGSQLRNLDNGIITTFDSDGNIYHQAAYGNIINPSEGMHTDFKIVYDSTVIKEEENKLDEVRNQIINGQQI